MITCEQCMPDSTCCRDVIVEFDEPETLEDWDEIRWMVSHKNVAVYMDDDDDWVVEFKTPCDNLDHQGKCKIYETRPKTCRDHKVETCVRNGEGTIEKIRFDTGQEVIDHVENVVMPEMLEQLKKDKENIENWQWGKDQMHPSEDDED